MPAQAPERSHIDPDCLYTLKGFQRVSGISSTRMREARLQGLHPPKLTVGKRVFIRGAEVERVDLAGFTPAQ